METIETCLLCGASNGSFALYCQKDGYSIVRCRDCGLIFVNPRDDREQIARQYEEDMNSPIGYFLNSANEDAKIFKKRLNWIESIASKGRLLDIGCNVGTYMEIARDRGWSVTGIDVNKKAYQLCKTKNFDVHSGLFSQELIDRLPRKDFDLVCINDVIEHLPDPLDSMRLVHQLISRDGYLSINTPNMDNIFTKVFQVKPEEHIFYFNKKTAVKTLTQSGFKIVKVVKTGRRRNFDSLKTGATIKSPLWCKICALIAATKLDILANWLLENFVTDELFILAKKA